MRIFVISYAVNDSLNFPMEYPNVPFTKKLPSHKMHVMALVLPNGNYLANIQF